MTLNKVSVLQQIFSPIQKEVEALNEHYKTILQHNDHTISNILSSIHFSEGKRLRPAMVFLSAGIAGKINSLTQTTALGLELLHYSSLMHDDVIDYGTKRRNQPTLNALWNNKIAVLTGDYLLSECMNLIAKTNNASLILKLVTIAKTMAYGELLQLSKSYTTCLNEKEYMEIIRYKTANLISACFEMGVASCTSDEVTINRWKQFGEEVGVIFQLKDDLFDYQVNNTSPKDAHKDIQEHKITLPLIVALQKTSESKRQQLLDLYRNHSGNSSEIQDIIHLVSESGGIDYTETLIKEKINHCFDFVNQQNDSDYKQSLLLLLNFIRDRGF